MFVEHKLQFMLHKLSVREYLAPQNTGVWLEVNPHPGGIPWWISLHVLIAAPRWRSNNGTIVMISDRPLVSMRRSIALMASLHELRQILHDAYYQAP